MQNAATVGRDGNPQLQLPPIGGDGTGEESERDAWLLVHASLLLNAGGRLSGPCNGTLTSSSGHPAVPQQCFHFTAQIQVGNGYIQKVVLSKKKTLKAFFASLDRLL